MVGQTVLGKYRLLQSLGRGSNAEVYLAVPLRFPEYRVVVKRIHNHVVAQPRFRQQFEAEFQSMANFDHPYAIGLIEASLDDPIGPCLVMEYAHGITLETLLTQQKRIDPERAGRLLGCCCHALQAAHDAGICHRDLKPANLMVLRPDTPNESLKVMDFGFAGMAAKPHLQLAELTGNAPIFAVGTPAYVSPEMIRGDRVDGRSDLYAVGVILFEMLTGWLPFNFYSMDRLLAAHLNDSPPRFQKLGCSDVPAAVETVVQNTLAKFPNERPQSAAELAEAFGQALGRELWKETAPEGWEPAATQAAPPPRVAAAPQKAAIEPYQVRFEFQVSIPERLAAAKLRGFVDDVGGDVLASDPGLVRIQVGAHAKAKEPANAGRLLGWLSGQKPRAEPKPDEQIEVQLHMVKPDPRQSQLNVIVSFQPTRGFRPNNVPAWNARCEKLYRLLRQYLGA